MAIVTEEQVRYGQQAIMENVDVSEHSVCSIFIGG
jgi:hypothetical protein